MVDIEHEDEVYRGSMGKRGGSVEDLNNNDVINRSSIFNFLYFMIIFLYAVSTFLDLIFYFCFYQKKKNNSNFVDYTFGMRLAIDVAFVLPLFLTLRLEYQFHSKINLITGLIFSPQIILNFITSIMIFCQDYTLDFSEDHTEKELTAGKVSALKISSLVNFVCNLLLVIFTFIKINKNY